MTKDKKGRAGLPALVLALTATATGGCYALNAPYAYVRIDAPNVGSQPAPSHKREVVHYSQGQQLPPQDHSCNTFAATAADSMLPPEKRTTITMCADGRQWTNYPAPQPAPQPAPAPQPMSMAPAPHYAPQGEFNVGELTQEFWSELHSESHRWFLRQSIGSGEESITRTVAGNLQGRNPLIMVCQSRTNRQGVQMSCYIDGGDPVQGEFIDGNVDYTLERRFNLGSGGECLAKTLSGDPSCMMPHKVQPHERHIKNQEYHRAARWAIRAHQRR